MILSIQHLQYILEAPELILPLVTKKKKILFIFGCMSLPCLHSLSLVVGSRGFSLLSSLLLLWRTGSRHTEFSSSSTWVRWLWLWALEPKLIGCSVALVAPQHAGSSQTRDQTCVPCIGRWIALYCTTWKSSFCPFRRTSLMATFLSIMWLARLKTVSSLKSLPSRVYDCYVG